MNVRFYVDYPEKDISVPSCITSPIIDIPVFIIGKDGVYLSRCFIEKNWKHFHGLLIKEEYEQNEPYESVLIHGLTVYTDLFADNQQSFVSIRAEHIDVA